MVLGLGNDEVVLGNGYNTISFQSGSDISLNLGAAFDRVAQATGEGLDTLAVFSVNEVITSSGNDNINGNPLDNVISTGKGNDTINSGQGNDIVNAGLGDDFINTSHGYDILIFGDQNVTDNPDLFLDLRGSKNKKAQDTNYGLDTIYTNNVEEVVSFDGDDTIHGVFNNNVFKVGDGDNTVFAYGGDDLIEVGSGYSDIFLGSGNDTVKIVGEHGALSIAGFGSDDHIVTSSNVDMAGLQKQNGNIEFDIGELNVSVETDLNIDDFYNLILIS